MNCITTATPTATSPLAASSGATSSAKLLNTSHELAPNPSITAAHCHHETGTTHKIEAGTKNTKE